MGEEVEEACKDSAIWDILQKKPDKLLTMVAVGGTNFSGGEKQRISIARAIVRKPDVILLDEATASLDATNERLVQESLDKLARKGSSLVIAHRLSTVKDSDRIIVLDKGRKVEEGTHDELLAKGNPADDPPPELEVVRSKSSVDADRSREPLELERFATYHASFMQSPDSGGVTYRKLWEATTGEKESSMSVMEMEAKIAQMEAEIAKMQNKVSKIQAHTRPLRENGVEFGLRDQFEYGLRTVPEVGRLC